MGSEAHEPRKLNVIAQRVESSFRQVKKVLIFSTLIQTPTRIKSKKMSFLSFDDLSPYTLAGFTLNIEEKTALQSSMAVKRAEEKFDHIAFWGKIVGINKDYYIAQAWREGEWFTKKSFYWYFRHNIQH